MQIHTVDMIRTIFVRKTRRYCRETMFAIPSGEPSDVGAFTRVLCISVRENEREKEKRDGEKRIFVRESDYKKWRRWWR